MLCSMLEVERLFGWTFGCDGGTAAAGRGCSGARRAVLLTNYDWANTQTPTVDFGQDCRVMEVPCFRRVCW